MESTGAGPTEQAPKRGWAGEWLDAGRTLVALLLLASALAVVVLSYVSDAFRVCHDEITPSSTVVRVCAPIGGSDLVPIGLAVLIALLLLPGVSEINLPGVGGIKRDLQAQRRATDELTRGVAQLQTTVSQISQVSQSQSGSFVNEPHFHAHFSAPEAAESTDQKIELLRRGEPPIVVEPPRTGRRRLSPDRASSESALLDLASTLDMYLHSGSASPRPVKGGLESVLSSPEGDARRDWTRDFREELATFLNDANTLRHSPARLSDEQVESAVGLGERLVEAARRYADHASQAGLAGERGMIQTFARWLTAYGWTVESRGTPGGPDLVAERSDERLVADIKAGTTLSMGSLDRSIGSLVRWSAALGATSGALVVPSPAFSRLRDRDRNRLMVPGIRLFTIDERGVVQQEAPEAP